ncbi:helix-turn-helix transcriptional regulator [Paenibacillus koleovorans]|uniref:helix-turn-helix transcriptional regulator n=1 Tax=Paenibacillus koleovorans TaxID=121608 RepID=UPI000FDAB062|nr:AraC family transcriptional regulator [Paenibacillus koleovorans]
MAKFMNHQIGPLPIQIVDLKVDRSKLKLKSLTIRQFGHLPGRTLLRDLYYGKMHAFTYISRGSGYLQVGDEPPMRLEAGSLFLEWPEQPYRFGPTSPDGWDEYYVVFEGSRVQEWLDCGLVRKDDPIMQVGLDPLWVSKLEAIGAALESGMPDNADRAALLLESLVYDFSQAHYSLKTAAGLPAKQELVLRVLETIAGRLYQPWNEREVWEACHISRSTLRRIVLHNTGFPLNDYVNRLKVDEAKKLLRHTSLQIKEIAQMLGFEDAAYFSRLFRKIAATSAQAFRTGLAGGIGGGALHPPLL